MTPERADLARAHVLEQRAAREIHVDAPRNEIVEHGAGAAIRHMGHVEAGHLLEQLDGEMRCAAGAGRCHRDLARVGFRMGDEFLHRLGRRRVRHEHVVREVEEVRDRRKVGDRIVAERPVQARATASDDVA